MSSPSTRFTPPPPGSDAQMSSRGTSSLEARVLELAARRGQLGASGAVASRAPPPGRLPPSAPQPNAPAASRLEPRGPQQQGRGERADRQEPRHTGSSKLPPPQPWQPRNPSQLSTLLGGPLRGSGPHGRRWNANHEPPDSGRSRSASASSSSSDGIDVEAAAFHGDRAETFGRSLASRRSGPFREESDIAAAGRSVKRRLKTFSLLDLDSKLCNKKDLSRCIRRNRRSIKWALGILLAVLLMGLYSMLNVMVQPDLPDDFHDFTEQEWRAAGLGVPEIMVQQAAARQQGDFRAQQIHAVHALRSRAQAVSQQAPRP